MKKIEQLNRARKLSPQEIAKHIAALKKQLLEASQQKALGKLKNYRSIRDMRREIARYSTIMDEKIASQLGQK